jgi:hypothetical protein
VYPDDRAIQQGVWWAQLERSWTATDGQRVLVIAGRNAEQPESEMGSKCHSVVMGAMRLPAVLGALRKNGYRRSATDPYLPYKQFRPNDDPPQKSRSVLHIHGTSHIGRYAASQAV